jgi:hypothetical protein
MQNFLPLIEMLDKLYKATLGIKNPRQGLPIAITFP